MAMLEMVFVLPVLLVMVFAIAQFGLLFQRWLTLNNAVREGARELALYSSPCSASNVVSEVKETVRDYAASGGIAPGSLIVTVTGACSGNGGEAQVTAGFPYDLQVPYTDLDTIELFSASTMRHE